MRKSEWLKRRRGRELALARTYEGADLECSVAFEGGHGHSMCSRLRFQRGGFHNELCAVSERFMVEGSGSYESRVRYARRFVWRFLRLLEPLEDSPMYVISLAQ